MLFKPYSQPLKYELHAFEPYISRQTMDRHYNAHYLGYCDNLAKLIPDENKDLVKIIKQSFGRKNELEVKIYNNAGQIFNHDQFWACLKLGTQLSTDFAKVIDGNFGSFEGFASKIIEVGAGLFGSGWVWLVRNQSGLEICATSNADSPATDHSVRILACIDIWEHAYYLDYQQDRKSYIRNIVTYLWDWRYISNLYLS